MDVGQLPTFWNFCAGRLLSINEPSNVRKAFSWNRNRERFFSVLFFLAEWSLLCSSSPRSLPRRPLLLHSRMVPEVATAAMAENEAGVSQQPKAETNGSDGTTQNKELGNLAANIIPHILNLYCIRSTAADYEIYAPNATFEDPVMKANGVKQIKSAFYSMPKILSEGDITEYHVKETETASGFGEILIDTAHHYKVWGKAFAFKSLIKLQVENGKVTSHQDLWNKNPLWTKDTVRVPLVGRAAQGWRRFNGIVTHTLMGFGKDPEPTK